jgi:FAD/FMN-containing dehydrogenase
MLAVELARNHALEIAVRAGSHSYQGWGTSDGLVIDLSGMKQVSIDPASRVGRVDTGVLSGEFVRAAGPHGLAPVLGDCPGVGVAGLTLGGGLGWLSGLHAAACDNLLSARVVTADGRILVADASSNPDLFWAIRGGSGNFGVATSFDCRLHAVGTVTAGRIYYSLGDARTVLRFFREWMAEAPDSLQADVNLTPKDRSMFVRLCHAGDTTEAERLLRPLRTVATPSKDTVERQDYTELAGMPPSHESNASALPGFGFTKGVYLERMSDEAIDATLDRLAQAPDEARIGFGHYMHGEVCRVKPEATAFELRAPGAVHMRIGLTWEDTATADRLMTWADETWRLLRRFSANRIYANYQSYEGNDAAKAVFAGNHSRLVSIKRKFDPTNLFRRNSNVQPMV